MQNVDVKPHNLRKGLPALSYGIAGIIALASFFLGFEITDSIINVVMLMIGGSTAGGLISKGVQIYRETKDIVKSP